MNPFKRSAKKSSRAQAAALFPDFAARASRPLDPTAQVQLKLMYRHWLDTGAPLPPLRETGFQCFSQTDEDGILLFIFSVIGAPTKTCVEICAGDGLECNTANLILHHGWDGLLVDGDEILSAKARRFFATHPATYVHPPAVVRAWVTRANVNALLREHGFDGELDLLSLDMDGIDYWIWDAIEVVQPRVVVVEYQDILGPERSVTVPYQEDFRVQSNAGADDFFGASLPAFAKLAARKGYRLIGCNRLGYNAFFLRTDLGPQIPNAAIADCFTHPKVRAGMAQRAPLVAHRPWQEV